MQLGLLQNLKINAPQADQSALLEKATGEINGDFAGLMNLETLLQNPEALSFEEQSKLLKEIVVDLPAESLQELTAIVKENFGDVIDTFPKLKQSLDQGDVKAFVNALTKLSDKEQVEQMQAQDGKTPVMSEQVSSKSEKSSEANPLLPTKLNVSKESTQLEKGEAKKTVVASDDFLNMKKVTNKKKPINQIINNKTQEMTKGERAQQIVEQAPNEPVEFMKQMRPNKQMALYSQQSDQFTDKFIKPTNLKNSESAKVVQNNGESISNSNIELAAIGSTQGQDGQQAESQMQNNESSVNLKANQVLNLSQISAKSPEQLITKISDYIQQNAIMNNNKVEMIVTHEDLGQFKVNVAKMGKGNELDIAIETVTRDGHKFFAENEVELIKSLNNNGIKLSGLKISQITDGKISSFTDNSRNLSDNNSQQGNSSSQGQQQNFGRNQHQQSGQERRRELWNMYREQANYSAA